MCVSYVHNDGQWSIMRGTPRDTVEWSGDRWQMSRDDWKEEFFFFFCHGLPRTGPGVHCGSEPGGFSTLNP